MEADHLYTVAGTGTCGSSARGEAATSAEVDDPVALAVDGAGDLFIADHGDDDVLEVPVKAGKYYGTAIGPMTWMSSSGWAETGRTWRTGSTPRVRPPS